MVLTRKLYGQVPIELEFSRLTMNFISITIVLLFSGVFFAGTAFAQETSSIEVTIENTGHCINLKIST